MTHSAHEIAYYLGFTCLYTTQVYRHVVDIPDTSDLEWLSVTRYAYGMNDNDDPFECDMGLDDTLTSHIERVADEFDMASQSAV